tara:strand:+ start:157 stop:942 length:786 start_codon:yes stop_codon:yes gene_type:complete
MSDAIVDDISISVKENTVDNEKSCMEKIQETTSDQDFQQRVSVGTSFITEVFKVIMGALLIIFVPQLCDDHTCSITENMNSTDDARQIAIGFNYFTAASFFILYLIEVKRENKLITYLDVNRFTPVDNDSVGEALINLPMEKRDTILAYDGYYQKIGYIASIAFVVNAIISGIVINENYADSKTATVFVTNLLLMVSKVSEVFSIVNTKKNVFYSAYLTDRVQYNNVDPDKAIDVDAIEDGDSTDQPSDENSTLVEVTEEA